MKNGTGKVNSIVGRSTLATERKKEIISWHYRLLLAEGGRKEKVGKEGKHTFAYSGEV